MSASLARPYFVPWTRPFTTPPNQLAAKEGHSTLDYILTSRSYKINSYFTLTYFSVSFFLDSVSLSLRLIGLKMTHVESLSLLSSLSLLTLNSIQN